MASFSADPTPAPPDRCGLIIVDLQHDFRVSESLTRRIQAAAGRYRVRVFTRFFNPKGSSFRTQLDYDRGPRKAERVRWRIVPGRRDIILDKPRYGLSEAQLRRLKACRCDEFVVCGVDTDACVLAVLFSLFDAGIRARVEPSLCEGKLTRQALAIMTRQFGWPAKKRNRRRSRQREDGAPKESNPSPAGRRGRLVAGFRVGMPTPVAGP